VHLSLQLLAFLIKLAVLGKLIKLLAFPGFFEVRGIQVEFKLIKIKLNLKKPNSSIVIQKKTLVL